VNQYSLDGVDIDWEYPDPGTSESTNYTSLMTQLSDAMHSRGKLLTCAVVGNGSTGGGVASAVFAKIDSLNIMAYDANNFQHSTYTYATQCLDYWVTSRGCPASKAALGVPFYSRPSDFGFNVLLSKGADPFADVWGSEGYNGITTIKKKTNLCFDRSIGGIMMWELSQDATGTNSLLTAIDQVVKLRQGGGGTARTFEAESLTVSGTSGDAVATNTDGGSGGGYVQLMSNAVGDFITFTLPNVSPATYTVTIGMKKNTNRGIVQTLVGPAGGTLGNLGSPIDMYGSSSFTSTTLTGTWNIGTLGNKSVQFKVTGKNGSSTSYNVAIDYIKLTPQ
jgi:hypothetical protein